MINNPSDVSDLNASLGDPTDAPVTVPGTDKTVVAYTKGALNLLGGLAEAIIALGPFGNPTVEITDSSVRYAVYLFDPGGNILTDAETTPGNFIVHRVRAGVDTEIVASTGSTELNGVISAVIDFSDGNWAEDDLGYVEFSGIIATKGGSTTAFPILRKGFRITPEPDIEAQIAVIDGNVDDIETVLGVSTDAMNVNTVYSHLNNIKNAVQLRVLIVVNDTSSLDVDKDTALIDGHRAAGYEVIVADHNDIAGSLELSYDFISVAGSVLAADAADLAPLQFAECPVVIFNAEIAASVVFNLGATPGTVVAQTQVEVTDNTVEWLIDFALGDVTITASATLETLDTKATNAIETVQQQGVGTKIISLFLAGGEEDGGAVPYTVPYSRHFIGTPNFTLLNDTFDAAIAVVGDHVVQEARYTGAVDVNVKRTYQESIPDVEFSKSAIDTTLSSNPPSADSANSIVDLDVKTNLRYVLRSLWINTTSFGTGAKITYKLWTLLNAVVTKVVEVDVAVLGIQSLPDLFGLQEVHGDGVWITAQTDVGNTGACSGTYCYAEARK